MKTKITLLISAIWAVLVALNESDVLDLIPQGGEWIKFAVAFLVVIGNALFVEPKKARDMINKSIGGGGIKPNKP